MTATLLLISTANHNRVLCLFKFTHKGGDDAWNGAFDAKLMLSTIASRGYMSHSEEGLDELEGCGARMRDGACDEALYAYGVWEEKCSRR
jgi:hypothetical protein